MVLHPHASHLQAKVPHGRTWTLPTSVPKQTTHLPGLGWQQPHMLVRCSRPYRLTRVLAAISSPDANTGAATAEFPRAGIPEEVTSEVLKYQPYLRWDVQSKLRPALALWVKQLGSQQLSARLLKQPKMLVRTPEECNGVYLWLASIGADAERIQQQVPQVMARPLDQVQSTVWAVQHILQLTDNQLPTFLKRHAFGLRYTPERVGQTIHTVAELLEVPVTSQDMHEVIMCCGRHLFQHDPAKVSQRISFFCDEFGGGQPAAKRGVTQRMYQMPPETMRARADELREMLGWTEDELNHRVAACPSILSQKPSTKLKNIQKLQAYGFSSAQTWDVYASFPTVAGYDFDSAGNVEKLTYLRQMLQLSPAEIASKPRLLATSFERTIGPRSEFLYACKGISPDTPLGLSRSLSYLTSLPDAKFASHFNDLSASPQLKYDDVFKQHWQQRWSFLILDMGLSYDDIAACRRLLQISLPNTLAPRWHFLVLLEVSRTEFKAADHLIALATLSDEHFAQAFSSASMGLVYDQNFMHRVRGNLCRFCY
ncbi:hypothetical protein ABBQ38_008668 [Trebouxia sp. C0009 RCD-2024]